MSDEGLPDEYANGLKVLDELCAGRTPDEIDALIAQFDETMKLPFFRSLMGVVKRFEQMAVVAFIRTPEGRKIGGLEMNEDRWRGHINALVEVQRFPDLMRQHLLELKAGAGGEKHGR